MRTPLYLFNRSIVNRNLVNTQNEHVLETIDSELLNCSSLT